MVSGPPAQVTGISPVEGVPGTKLTLRGENFGQTALDLTHVFVGGIDVSPSARWFSSRKLSVITPLGTGELEIVVVTKSGGIGTSELTYSQHVDQKIGPQEQVSYWPEDERRRCPAIIERGSGGIRQEGGGDVVDASLAATGLPTAELARLGIPLSDTALMKIYPRTFFQCRILLFTLSFSVLIVRCWLCCASLLRFISFICPFYPFCTYSSQ